MDNRLDCRNRYGKNDLIFLLALRKSWMIEIVIMNVSKYPPLPTIRVYISRIIQNLLIGFAIIAFSLGLGMMGYRFFEKMEWLDAFLNASMILSGMGPVSTLHTDEGKIFAGFYALFSGIIFLVVIAIIIAPVFHRFLHKFHIKDTN